MTMAYAAYSEFLGASLPVKTAPRLRPEFVVMSITVPSTEAHRVRRALAMCPGAGVLRCIPQPQDSLVQLQVHVCVNRLDEVMHQVIVCVPSGQIGRIAPWAEHLAKHGVPHGL
jgi:hypothetical protein